MATAERIFYAMTVWWKEFGYSVGTGIERHPEAFRHHIGETMRKLFG